MPDWYPLVRAVRFYNGAYKLAELAREPVAVTRWALTAEAAENEGERIAREIAKQQADLAGDDG
jgi:hypothetical protein